jgi:outer membrane protein
VNHRPSGSPIQFRALVALAFVTAVSLSLSASVQQASAATSTQGTVGNQQSTVAPVMPNAVPSLPPAQQATTLRYPLYGPVVSGIAEGISAPGIPAAVSLHQATLIAAALSPTLAAARADVGVAAAQVRLARAGLLPSIQGSASTSHSWTGGGQTTGLNNNGQTVTTRSANSNFQNNGLSATLSQLIFDGGQIEASVRAAKHSETSAADTYRRELQTLNYTVAQAYYSALNAERTTQVDIELVREDAQQEALVAAEVRAGTAAMVDQITTELPVSQAQVAAVQAQGAQVSALAALANIMGLPANIAVQPVDDGAILSEAQSTKIAAEVPAPSYTQAFTRALAMRPDVDAAHQITLAGQDTLREARLGYMPRITGSYTTGIASTNIGGGNFGHSNALGASLSIPIFDPGTIPADIAIAKANLAVDQANERSTNLTVSLNVRQGLSNLVSAQEALRASAVTLREATVILHSTQAQYRAGVTTLPQLLNAQVGLSQALVSQVSTAYALRQAEQAYFYAIGEDSTI